jgi:hypothetical protein
MTLRGFPWFKKSMAGGLAALLISSTGLVPKVRASLAPAETAVESPVAGVQASSREEDVKAVRAALASAVVRGRLAALKLSPAEIDARLDKMSDRQVHAAAMQAKALNPGGDGGVVSVLLVVALVLFIIYLVRRV